MLLQIAISNFRSFRNEVLLNLAPVKSRLMKDHIIHSPIGKKISALPIATIYGANASGKSNFIKAVDFAKSLIIDGTSSDDKINFTPFILDLESESKPAKIEFIFKTNDVLYTYGFLATRDKITEEWLFANYTSQESKIFERITNKEGNTIIDPGAKLANGLDDKKFIDYVARGTRSNQLFLFEANEKNISIVKPAWDWFKNSLFIIFPNSNFTNLITRAHTDSDFLKHLESVLQTAGTGVDGLYCKKALIDNSNELNDAPRKLISNMKNELKKHRDSTALIRKGKSTYNIRLSPNDELEAYSLMTVHKHADGSSVHFDTSDESDGTLRLMHLAPMLRHTTPNERVYLIDEIDRSLHPHISKLFIEIIINSAKSKDSKNQFIVTTHDTNLLDRNLLRRDEIWFIEKSKQGVSHLTSLAEYKISDGLSYQNGYLNGRFGAIPFIGNVKSILK